MNRTKISFDKLNKISTILKVISHPVKLEILEILEKSEPLSVAEIHKKVSIEIEQSMLSHHLIKMKDKNVLKSSKKGKNNFYEITDRKILNIFSCIDKCDII